jgi:transmembrane sensor
MNKHAPIFKWSSVAASLILVVTLALILHSHWQRERVITTGASQWHHTTLPDGTGIHVDARSTVKVEYTDDARIVHVDQGSAVFEVAKDLKRPFIARTRLIDATAVGTRFGVAIDPGVTTTVSEGAVKITARGQHTRVTGIVLNAGEELRVPDARFDAPTYTKVDAERKLEWANGWLVFEGATIGEVVHELNRRNAVQIEIALPEIAARTIGFQRFRVDSSAAFARSIAETNELALVEDPSRSVLQLRPKQFRGD